jgi:hypothetical protein
MSLRAKNQNTTRSQGEEEEAEDGLVGWVLHGKGASWQKDATLGGRRK